MEYITPPVNKTFCNNVKWDALLDAKSTYITAAYIGAWNLFENRLF